MSPACGGGPWWCCCYADVIIARLRFEFGPVWRQSGGGGDAAASAHLLPEELFVADFDIAIHARPSDSVDAAALIECRPRP
jgi:hypothetical protein